MDRLSFEFELADDQTIDVALVDADETVGGNQGFRWGGMSLKGKGYLWVEDRAMQVLIQGNTDDDADAEFAVAVEAPYSTMTASNWTAEPFLL